MNNPTLTEFCFGMIGRADIEGSKSNVAMNAWLPQASSSVPPAREQAARFGVLIPLAGLRLSAGSSPYLKPPLKGGPTTYRALSAVPVEGRTVALRITSIAGVVTLGCCADSRGAPTLTHAWYPAPGKASPHPAVSPDIQAPPPKGRGRTAR